MAAARGPREGHEPSSADNVRLQKTVTGTVHKQIGESSFYAKHGIKPIADTLDHSTVSSIDLESPIKMKNVRKLHDGSTKFPKLAECAHFHYDFTELAAMVVSICEENQENFHHQAEPPPGDIVFYLTVFSNERSWVIRRTHNDFKIFDKQVHKCIFDRKFSLLPDLRRHEKEVGQDGLMALRKLLALYLRRFSSIAGNMINCGPILSWLEMDNRGNRLMVTDDSEINTPAVSAGHVTKRYTGQAPDELTIQVGDIISIIDMAPGEETVWWRGKNQYQVGFFPCECVELISDKSIRQSMEGMIPEAATKPVLRKRGKLISFLRAFFTSRPARTQLQRTGIVKQRIFGCDLGEHLSNSGLEVPKVLTSCAVVIEEHGIVDGIYRLSGVASNIQKLRNDFDDEKEPCLTDEIYLQDIHSISSLLKAYLRELPNPLLTYQLYDKFSEAVSVEEHKLLKIHDVIQQLPPPHYRTAEHLFKHLNRVSKFGRKTGMHCKNLAIVWAPNLMRSKELESMCNTAMLQGVGVQAIVTEFLIQYADIIFSDKLQNVPNDTGSTGRRQRPKSLAISTPTKLLSLEEAREQMLTGPYNESPKQKFIEVGGGPSNLPDYHTVIDLPTKKKNRKERRSPALTREQSAPQPGSGWKSIFSRKKQDSLKSNSSEVRVSAQVSEPAVSKHRKLRTVRSADSLISSSNSEQGGKSKPSGKFGKDEDFPPVRPKALYQTKDGHRTLSYDLTHSESDMSEPETMVISMEAELVPRPASASAELTGHRGELMSEIEHTLSVKTKTKKGKTGKDLKKSKKKQRSASAGQPIEGIPAAAGVNLHSRSKSTSHTEHHYATSEPTAPVVGHPPPPSPSLKDRLVQALTPTSPRKRIKGPAPSPPQSPPTTLTEGAAKIKKKSASGKSKSLPKTLPTFDQVQKHSKSEINQGSGSEKYTVQTDQGLQNPSESSHLAQLSPIEEALQSDISSTPDREQQFLAAKLQQSHLQTWSKSQYEAPEGETMSFGNLTDQDVFQETEKRLENQASYNSSRYSTPSLGQQNEYQSKPVVAGYNKQEPDYSGFNRTEQKLSREDRYSGRSNRNDTRATEGQLSNTEMSMSLDSLLKEVVGSENYQSDFGSNTSFRTFGKSTENTTVEHSNKNVMPTAQQPPPPPQQSADVSHDLQTYRTEEYVGKSLDVSEPAAYPRDDRDFIDDLSTEHITTYSTHSTDEEVEEEEPGMIDMDQRSLATPTSLLETDLDSFDVTAETPEEFLEPTERVTVHRAELSPSEEEHRAESQHYIAPLPGDIHMMSQYPDLIPHNVLQPQIDLQDSDVQYVDPRSHDIQQTNPYQWVPDVSLEAEAKTADYNKLTMSPTEVREDRTVFYSEPEPMVTIDRQYGQVTTDLLMTREDPHHYQSDIKVGQDDQHFNNLRSERGEIVIRKPLDDSSEGSTFIPVKTRVVPPPRQFAYSAPPTAASEDGEEEGPVLIRDHGQEILSEDDGETAIDTPSDEFPPPPPPCVVDKELEEVHMATDGYLADRSGSTSPANNTMETRDHFQAKLKAAASQPVTIDEEEVAMVISPTCSVSSKTPESDSVMVTSSFESDHVLEGYKSRRDFGMYSHDRDERSLQQTTEDAQHHLSETMESELVFQMDDVKSKTSSLSKSVDSLQNLSMSSEDPESTLQDGGLLEEDRDLVIRETRESKEACEEREYVIEDTQSQLDYYFTYGKTHEEDQSKPSEDFSEVLGKFSSISTEALVSTITVEDVEQKELEPKTGIIDDKPKTTVIERVQSQEEPSSSKMGQTEKKATPVRRKKSVKELLSKFEVAGGSSPPSDQEVGKSKPQVFQKPRVVRLHSLNKSSDVEDTLETEISKSPPKKDDVVLMSASCPDTSRLLSLSPRPIDLENEASPVTTFHRSNTDIKAREPPAVSKKPSIKNKIQQFESSESLTSDTEHQVKSVSPGRVSYREEESPLRGGSGVKKERAFSPIPPAKPVIIQERTSPKQADSNTSQTTTTTTRSEKKDSPVKEESNYSFPQSQKSELSPKFTRRSSGGGSESRTPASFQLRAATLGLSSGILKETQQPSKSEETSEKKLQSLTERMKRFQSTSEEENTTSSSNIVKDNPYSSIDRSYTNRSSGNYNNRRASVEPKQLFDTSVSMSIPPRDHSEATVVVSTHDQYSRSSSVPNAYSGRLSYKSTPSSEGPGVAMDTDESVPLKPSQLLSRKAKKPGETPSVDIDSVELGSKTNKDDANLMSSSFSDRRKLFESSTDSGISTSSHGSLKRSEVFVKPKQQNAEANAMRKDSNNVTHQEINLTAHQGKDTSLDMQRQVGTAADYTSKIRQFGNKTVVIEAGDSNKSGTASHKLSSSGMHTGTTGNGNLSNRAKPYERDQKENVKPAAVFKSFDNKDTGVGTTTKERSGTVKDLWRKFEQQNQ